MLRITSGKYRNIRIEQPDKAITRASSEKLREAVFSSIAFDLENTVFLDLFSGSGAFGFEAISRGCKKAIMVEKNKQAYKIILLNKLKIKDSNISTFNADALSFLFKYKGEPLDFIFIDPPYNQFHLYDECMQQLFLLKLIHKNSVIITESDQLIESINNYTNYKTKKYGISFLQYWNVNISK
ncbi:16S rRNA (guanine(966)-N(2))-methyltransferase RsmD [Mycoplasma phocoenae]|uniref:16S rRNA (Guanine(966)-N(2))-methyltransferase RsmD n=1 Tax=Mycoplasma phocoenae TaxID=754517 RepID=A0A858U613_9MOLU|nr:16S rRNA (guanine(966)-N(2))-methyltransferase RsmD [Mycoplasma phocoenae]QJG66887.1 16S rRNA (guanine(966)-N(2))-methyltransferase RsmD [Mycoplasma phocoenae]